MNWLQGTPTTVNPRGPNSSCSASSAAYCGVRPHLLATFTTSAGVPPVSSRSVVAAPWRVVTGTSRRSVMSAAAPSRRLSFQGAEVVGDVDGVLAQRLDGHDLQRPLVRGGQDDARRGPRLVGLQPADGDHAPAVAGAQAGEAVLRSGRGQVVAELALHGEELGGDDRADGVRAQVLGPRGAVAVAVEAGQRVDAARLQWP